jgi:hypothetical protein
MGACGAPWYLVVLACAFVAAFVPGRASAVCVFPPAADRQIAQLLGERLELGDTLVDDEDIGLDAHGVTAETVDRDG